MNTQELKCFIAAADRLNFTRTARDLYVTTPTVTHHIQRLEEELGTLLFFRDSKTVRLTAAGELFYREAQEILSRMEGIAGRLEKARQQEERTFRIGCTMREEALSLAPALAHFRTQMPEVLPRIVIDDYFRLAGMLTEHQLDAFLGTREMTEEGPFRFLPLGKTRVFAAAREGLLPAGAAGMRLADLEGLLIIALRKKNLPIRKRDRIEQLLLARGRTAEKLRESDAEAVLALAEAGYGVALLPEHAIPKGRLAPETVLAEILDVPPIDYGILVRADATEPAAKCLADSLAATRSSISACHAGTRDLP